MSMQQQFEAFAKVANHPDEQLKAYKAQGKKAIGVMPYYAPEELVFAAGMVPMGMWGTNKKNIKEAKEYCASFYCSLAQLDLEMLLDGTLDDLDGVIMTTLCDTLRPMSQNIRVSMAKLGKMPTIFLAHPQNRRPEYGIQYTISQYLNVKEQLEEIAGGKITDEALKNAIKVYNQSRAERRRFVKLAGEHPEAVSAVNRSAALKASYFMLKDEYTEALKALNDELEALPKSDWKGVRVVTSGIICDNPDLLQILDDNQIAIAMDDVAHESRSFRTDAPEEGDPMRALAQQFADLDYSVLLYDEASAENRRAEHVADLVREYHAQGVVVFMQNFCDPEEMEYPSLRQELDKQNIRHIRLGIDHQMRDFGQAKTALQAFADVIADEMA
ncbi:(R)-2-hydroxyglutaryl-CoA dehydratase subunit beta [Murdochiella massiliensis]|uniref:(R)-2-hydroxyglutaryl-CoA dehydratase subunit beta n=1 Tax=Murdochiella massiliensis TaxID=1673723 RepID=UPI00082E8781|nr:(R)-2-hydroxyglutaryl-CoA dehydratase subunit beta [Murdochiella massiliensis]